MTTMPRRRYRQGVDRRFLRPGWIAGHVLVFLAVLTCLRLGWWQWERTQETTGTAQNFGYALLWPAFGAAFVFMWVRFLHLEVVKDVEDDEQTDRDLRELLEAEGVVHPEPEPAGGTESETDQSTESEPLATNRPGPPTARNPTIHRRGCSAADRICSDRARA